MKRLTRSQAIKELCKECQGYDGRRAKLAGTKPCGNGNDVAFRMARECEDKFCPLWPYRIGKEQTETEPAHKISVKHSRRIYTEQETA